MQKNAIRELVDCKVWKLADLPLTLFRIHTGLYIAVSMCHNEWNFISLCVYCSDVNKDLELKTKAKNLDPKTKTKA